MTILKVKILPSFLKRIGVRSLSTYNKEDIFGKHTRTRCIEKLRNLKFVRLGDKDANQLQRAAVLVPLCYIGGEPSVVYTVRSAYLKRNGGHVSFPGGLKDEKDASLEQTVLRETFEELGIENDVVDIWGHGSFIMTADQNVLVMPYVGYVGELDIQQLHINHSEVAHVFSVPLKTLCEPKFFAYTQFRGRYVLPVFECAEHRIWGLTALITHMVLMSLLPNVYKNQLRFIPPVKKPIA